MTSFNGTTQFVSARFPVPWEKRRKDDSWFEPVEKVYWELEKEYGIKFAQLDYGTLAGKQLRGELLVRYSYREIAQLPEFRDIKLHSLAKLYKDARKRIAAKKLKSQSQALSPFSGPYFFDLEFIQYLLTNLFINQGIAEVVSREKDFCYNKNENRLKGGCVTKSRLPMICLLFHFFIGPSGICLLMKLRL